MQSSKEQQEEIRKPSSAISTRNPLTAEIRVIGNNDNLIVLLCLMIPFLLKREITFYSENLLNAP